MRSAMGIAGFICLCLLGGTSATFSPCDGQCGDDLPEESPVVLLQSGLHFERQRLQQQKQQIEQQKEQTEEQKEQSHSFMEKRHFRHVTTESKGMRRLMNNATALAEVGAWLGWDESMAAKVLREHGASLLQLVGQKQELEEPETPAPPHKQVVTGPALAEAFVNSVGPNVSAGAMATNIAVHVTAGLFVNIFNGNGVTGGDQLFADRESAVSTVTTLLPALIGMYNPALGLAATFVCSIVGGVFGKQQPDKMQMLYNLIMKAVKEMMNTNNLAVKVQTHQLELQGISEELEWVPSMLSADDSELGQHTALTYQLMIQHDLAKLGIALLADPVCPSGDDCAEMLEDYKLNMLPIATQTLNLHLNVLMEIGLAQPLYQEEVEVRIAETIELYSDFLQAGLAIMSDRQEEALGALQWDRGWGTGYKAYTSLNSAPWGSSEKPRFRYEITGSTGQSGTGIKRKCIIGHVGTCTDEYYGINACQLMWCDASDRGTIAKCENSGSCVSSFTSDHCLTEMKNHCCCTSDFCDHYCASAQPVSQCSHKEEQAYRDHRHRAYEQTEYEVLSLLNLAGCNPEHASNCNADDPPMATDLYAAERFSTQCSDPQDCQEEGVGLYWCKNYAAAGIPTPWSKISTQLGEWVYDGVFTCVGAGGYGKACPPTFYCVGGDHYGGGGEQAKAVKEAIDNGGVHPSCP